MALNQRYPNALHIELPVPAGTKSGQPVQVGHISGVAQIDRQADGNATVWLDGSWDIEVTGAVANVGDPVYITEDRKLNASPTGNTPWGIALATKTAGAADLEVVPLGYTAPAPAAAGGGA